MQVFGFTINLLTLLAIVLSVGLVVDDAIVVVENVERHLAKGKSPREAAILGARELVGPLISMTITLAAVYAPIGLQGGLTGALFREFAFTLAGAVIISGIVAITLSPMMAANLLVEGMNRKRVWPAKSPGISTACGGAMARWLDVTLDARPAVYLVWLCISLLTIPMYTMSAKELAPKEDQGILFGIVDAAANSTLDQTSRYTSAANDIFFNAGNRTSPSR
jgi:multidrug efflux pump